MTLVVFTRPRPVADQGHAGDTDNVLWRRTAARYWTLIVFTLYHLFTCLAYRA
jgi:hypothetical protein